MFYANRIDKVLRFGDVVKGYISTKLTIKEPILSLPSGGHNYKINIELPNYSVILTPSCSISNGVISLTPLIRIRESFLKNPYFAKDLTRINRKMEPQQTIPPEKWKILSQNEKEKRLKEKMAFALLNYFIYDQNEMFEQYTIRHKKTRYYMIDFKDIHTVKCSKIQRAEMTVENTSIIESKILQLSRETRSELRDKIAYYYTRVPTEDSILED